MFEVEGELEGIPPIAVTMMEAKIDEKNSRTSMEKNSCFGGTNHSKPPNRSS